MLTPRMAAVPAGHTQVTSSQLLSFRCRPGPYESGRPQTSEQKCERSSGCRIRNLFGRGSSLRSRECDELYSCSGAGTFNWIPYSRRSSLKIGLFERQAISFPMNYAEITSSILKCLTAPT